MRKEKIKMLKREPTCCVSQINTWKNHTASMTPLLTPVQHFTWKHFHCAHIIQSVYHLEFCVTILSDFFLGITVYHDKLKTILKQIFGVGSKQGALWVMWRWWFSGFEIAMRLGRCRVELPCGIVLGDEYWPSFQRNSVIANKKSDSVSNISHGAIRPNNDPCSC